VRTGFDSVLTANVYSIGVGMRSLCSLFRTTNGNLIDELFAASAARKTELIRATTIGFVCLHEAGHVMMAELHQIPILSVNLPRLDNLSSPRRPNEKPEEELPGVEVPPGEALNKMVPFLLGGLFGELNIYDDDALNNPGKCHAYTYGCKGDLAKICQLIKGDQNPVNYLSLAGSINAAQAASRDGAERATFLSAFPFRARIEFQQFREHRARHHSIAAQLYANWKMMDFERWYKKNPRFSS